MLWRIIIIISLVSIVASGILWIKGGMVMWPHDREQVVTVVKDDLFGTTREETTWKNIEPAYGFFPIDSSVDAIPRSFIFVLGAGIGFSLVSMIMLKRQRTSTARS